MPGKLSHEKLRDPVPIWALLFMIHCW